MSDQSERDTVREEETLYRLCARCKEWKPQADFHNSRTGQFSYCRDCRRAYDRVHYLNGGKVDRRQRQRARRERMQEWLAGLKYGVPCSDCGGTFPSAVMHFDHLPGRGKLAAISSMTLSRSRRLVLEELEKCELVCANCHAIRTAARRKRPNGV